LAKLHRLRLLRAGLIARIVGAIQFWRVRKRGVLLWPPFRLPAEASRLDTMLLRAKHYLFGLNFSIEFYCDGPDGFSYNSLCLDHDGQVEVKASNPTRAAIVARHSRYLALHKASRRPTHTSLTPHQYLVIDIPNHLDSSEWLRLLWDVYRSKKGPIQVNNLKVPVRYKSCALLGSGPSISKFTKNPTPHDTWIAMNTAICAKELPVMPAPFAVVALDPLYFEPGADRMDFWTITFDLLRSSPAIFLTTLKFAPYIKLRFPDDIQRKCHFVRTPGIETLAVLDNWKLPELSVMNFGNVLTDLGLPIASAIADSVTLFGCDGRAPSFAGKNFDKDISLQHYDDDVTQNRPDRYDEKYLDAEIAWFYNMSRVVVDQCHLHGISVNMAGPTFNLGLQHLPIVPEEGDPSNV